MSSVVNYDNESVIVFEEFRSSLRIQDMLNYLDVYYLKLPSRYFNRVACYTEIYIVSNISLEEQYTGMQRENAETWKAFLRRIHAVKQYTIFGIEEYDSVKAYLNRFEVIQEDLGVF